MTSERVGVFDNSRRENHGLVEYGHSAQGLHIQRWPARHEDYQAVFCSNLSVSQAIQTLGVLRLSMTGGLRT